MNKKNSSKTFIISGAVVIFVVFIVWQIFWFAKCQSSNYIFDGVTINDVDLSGLDITSAQLALENYTQVQLQDAEFTVNFDGGQSNVLLFPFTSYDYMDKEMLAYDYARSGNKLADYFDMLKAKLFGVQFLLDAKIDTQALQEELALLSLQYYIPPVNAYIASFDPNAEMGERLTISDEVSGKGIDIEKTSQSITDAILAGKKTCDGYFADVVADITYELLLTIDKEPIVNEYSIVHITQEHEDAIMQIISSGRHKIINPGDEISIIEFLGGGDYIYYDMPEGGSRSDYEIALTEDIPTQIYITSLIGEVDVTQRELDDAYKKDLPIGTSTKINMFYDMKIKNNLDLPVILRIGYKRIFSTGQIYCQIYRAPMEYKALVRPIIKTNDGITVIEINRVYVDESGNFIDSVLIETVTLTDKAGD